MAVKESGNFERVPVNVTPRQRAFLESEADRLQISISDMVRRILDKHIDALDRRLLPHPSPSPEPPTKP